VAVLGMEFREGARVGVDVGKSEFHFVQWLIAGQFEFLDRDNRGRNSN
jgi:hypothetical protein